MDTEGFYLDDVSDYVDIRGVGGMKVGAVCRHYHHVRVTRPTIVYLDIETNDLSKPWCDPCALAGSIYQCARELQDFASVRHVVVGEIMRRRDPCRFDFEDARNDTNSELRRLVEGNSSIHLYPYRALSRDWEQYLLRDGVHLTKEGMGRYRKQIRKCVRHYAKK